MFWIFWKHLINTDNAGTSSVPKGKTTDIENLMAKDVLDTFSAHSKEAFCLLDAALNCLYLTGNWEDITGFPVKDIVTTGLRKLVAKEYTYELASYLSNFDTLSVPARFEMKFSDGDLHWCELRVSDIKRDKNGKAYYKCLLRDVSEAVIAQQDSEQSKVNAAIANKSRSEFLANMNHELRTPLNAILGFAQVMENGIFGDLGHPKYKDYIVNIQASGAKLLSKVNDLMEIANIDSGRIVLKEMECDLVQVVRDAMEFHSQLAFTEQVILHDNLPADPVYASVDRIRILQVVTNLISNAIKYSDKGSTVDIYFEKVKGGGINIVIDDNGCGISANHLKSILFAFNQENSFFARNRDCVGLGLALSKEIVKLHQGKIEIDSESGKGTTLRVMIPAARMIKNPKTKEVKETKAKKMSGPVLVKDVSWLE